MLLKEIQFWQNLKSKWSINESKTCFLFPQIIGNPLGNNFKQFAKQFPEYKSTFTVDPMHLKKQFLLAYKQYSTIVCFIASTKGICGSQNAKNCHGVVFIIINDRQNERKCKK